MPNTCLSLETYFFSSFSPFPLYVRASTTGFRNRCGILTVVDVTLAADGSPSTARCGTKHDPVRGSRARLVVTRFQVDVASR